MANIIVIGGHGKVALRLEKRLVERGDSVDAIIRNPEHVTEVESTGAHPIVADIVKLQVPEFADVLAGHDAVVWSAGAGGGSPERTYAVDRDAALRSFAAAQVAGVSRYVMVSYFKAGKNHGVAPDNSFFPYAAAKTTADAALEQSALDWTILRPSALTLEPGTGKIDLWSGQADATKSTQVSRDDVAAVIAAILPRAYAGVVDMSAPENALSAATIHTIIQFNNGSSLITDALARFLIK